MALLPEQPDQKRLNALLQSAIPYAVQGTVWSVGSNSIEAVALPVPMGASCRIMRRGLAPLPAQVIGFEGPKTLLASLDGSDGISPGDIVEMDATSSAVRVGRELLGRVIDAAGNPIDGIEPPALVARAPLNAPPVSAMQRPPIDSVLTTGVRAIDTMLTLGRGQRVGIFAGSGVGKSTLLGMMARGTSAEVVVIGLVGERGREVQEYLQRELDPATRSKCVTVVATSDQPALRRVQAAMTATSIAEYFRDSGKHVLLMMDSVTRFAMAQREIGLAAGEAPTTRGYPPSVFSMLPKLVERSGTGPTGSITGIYTVLVEGDDTNEPISDTLRGLLDGHFVLSRDIAQRGRYPAIDILSSLSRLQTHLADEGHLQAATRVRSLLSTHKANEDLITIGAYQQGSSPAIDQAIASYPAIQEFLAQPGRQVATWDDSLSALHKLSAQAGAPGSAAGIPTGIAANGGAQAAAQTIAGVPVTAAQQNQIPSGQPAQPGQPAHTAQPTPHMQAAPDPRAQPGSRSPAAPVPATNSPLPQSAGTQPVRQ